MSDEVFELKFHIKRSKRKSVVGYVMPDGNIEVRAPLAMTTEEIKKWIAKFEPKFLPMVNQARSSNALLSEHPFGYGGEVLFMGKWTPIRERTDRSFGLMSEYIDGAIVVKPGLSDEDMRYWVEDLFSTLAKPVFEQKLHYYSDLMDVHCRYWTIGNARKRHGSCDSNRKITLSWRIIMMSERVIDYIIVHELAHLKQLNHAKVFHDEVAAVLPDWKERKKEYGEYSRLLHCGGWI